MKNYSISKFTLIIIALLIVNSLFAQVVINEIAVNPSDANDGANMPNTSE